MSRSGCSSEDDCCDVEALRSCADADALDPLSDCVST